MKEFEEKQQKEIEKLEMKEHMEKMEKEAKERNIEIEKEKLGMGTQVARKFSILAIFLKFQN